MRRSRVAPLVLVAPLVVVAALAAAVIASPSREVALAGDMAEAARRYLSALTPEQRRRGALPFDAAERTRWRYTPGARSGLNLGDLDVTQRHLADGLMATALSREGLLKATGIMALDEVLRRRGGGSLRDPGAYALAIYGEPSTAATWGWRLEGHHLAIHATLVDGVRLIIAPTFLGANPAHVDRGELLGHTRVLGREEELGLALLAALDGEQRRQALRGASAPHDILSAPGGALTAMPGLSAARLSPAQRRLFDLLVAEIFAHLAPEVRERERARLVMTELSFAWAGAAALDRPHYFQVSGPTFLYELDNTQDGANHVHTVWHARDAAGGDFGVDLLREHRRAQPHPPLSDAEQKMLAELRGAWSRPVEPFRVVGNVYYVGAANIASYLIVTSAGLILIDTGTREMESVVRAGVARLGFDLADIKLILTSHAHFDHVEGHAAMKRLTGATVAAMAAEVPALTSGKDLSALGAVGWEPVPVDRVLRDGEDVVLGDVTLRALWTPGHTQGATSFTTTVRDHGRSYALLFLAAPAANAGVKLRGNPRHPTIVEDLARTHAALKRLRPDIYLTFHPEDLFAGKLEKLRAGAQPHPLVDPEGYRKLLAEVEADTQRALAAP